MWVLGGLAVLVVIVLTVAATLFVTRSGSDPTVSLTPDASGTPHASSAVASRGDRDAADVIHEDPTCAPWEPIARTLSEQQKNGWDRRDPGVPRPSWSPQQHEMYSAVAAAMRSAADQTVPLAKITPHRVMRELYEQSIAYWRAYVDSLDTYAPESDLLALVANSTSSAIVWICAAITYGSADARGPLVAPGSPPLSLARSEDVANPEVFLRERAGVCTEWSSTIQDFNKATDQWAEALDPNVPASQWTDRQHELAASTATIFLNNANEVQNLGAISQNPVLNDFATLAAQYQRAYAQALPSYTPADDYLNSTAAELVVAVEQACLSAKE
ncbi:hypothetical protein [Mycolicibacterium gilvum]|uniref:Uncharacterized protein n=1 Tax=Mycolicibacterium gilvum (strain DSM 45189 / LMG 24558 / Spyr1) TaxID=278137 RepID=E6THQ7_MYCSR|nr:hypothetical protein [Mycolicibacterium gilvum]ADT96806.1 hypothetical protein Mspyr1_00720 [Mycolicibacterium gilvum Spyr1]